jgi:hypothetical protein
MDQLQTRLDALEQQMSTVTRRLRWWRGLACAFVMLGLVGLPWYGVKTQAQAPEEVEAQEAEEVEAQALTLAQRVAALESKLRFVTRSGRNMFITGANLHIRNGMGSTDCTDAQGNPIPNCPNGRGNLIVGYNEPRVDGESIRTGSHNVVVGQEHNFTRFGGLVVGFRNEISGDFASVSGGNLNTASGRASSVSGGEENTASGFGAVVSGGSDNTASGEFASVSGGAGNTASGESASVSGGGQNAASGSHAVVSGGSSNAASGLLSRVSGGAVNTASGESASVSGGFANTASGLYASVSGGQNITQETEFGWSAGSEADEVVEGNFRSP